MFITQLQKNYGRNSLPTQIAILVYNKMETITKYLSEVHGINANRDVVARLLDAGPLDLQAFCEEHRLLCTNEELWRLLYQFNFPDLYSRGEAALEKVIEWGKIGRVIRNAAPWRDLYTETLAAAADDTGLGVMTYLINSFEVRDQRDLEYFVSHFPVVSLSLLENNQASPLYQQNTVRVLREAIIDYNFDLIPLLEPLSDFEVVRAAGMLPDNVRKPYVARMEVLLRDQPFPFSMRYWKYRNILLEALEFLLRSKFSLQRLSEITELAIISQKIDPSIHSNLVPLLLQYGTAETLNAVQISIEVPLLGDPLITSDTTITYFTKDKGFHAAVYDAYRDAGPEILRLIKQRLDPIGFLRDENPSDKIALMLRTDYDEIPDEIVRRTGKPLSDQLRLVWEIARNDLEAAQDIVASMKPSVLWKTLRHSLVRTKVSAEMLPILFGDREVPPNVIKGYIGIGNNYAVRLEAYRYLTKDEEVLGRMDYARLIHSAVELRETDLLKKLVIAADRRGMLAFTGGLSKEVVEYLEQQGHQPPKDIDLMSISERAAFVVLWARETERIISPYERELALLPRKVLLQRALKAGVRTVVSQTRAELARRIIENEEKVSLSNKTRKELFALAKAQKLNVTSRTKKADLINALLSATK